jgi:hypothetical protein
MSGEDAVFLFLFSAPHFLFIFCFCKYVCFVFCAWLFYFVYS